MINSFLIFPIILGFFITLSFLPSWIKRAHSAGLVGKDMNKQNKPLVAEAGGVAVIAGFIGGILAYIALKTFYFKAETNVVELFVVMTSILIVSFIGLVDGILGWKKGLSKKLRLFLVLFAAVPLMVINAGDSTISIGGKLLNLGLFYTFVLTPLAVIGCSTTFNFLAGFNGLEARQGVLILSALAIATWFTQSTWLTMVCLIMVSSLIAFLIFNNFPSQVFPGDVLTYSIGALIAVIAVLGNLEKFAVFIFIPNIIEVFLKLRGKLAKESFAMPRNDGSLAIPSSGIFGFGHLAIFIVSKFRKRVTESDVVWFINIIQLFVIILAFIIFKEGIFVLNGI